MRVLTTHADEKNGNWNSVNTKMPPHLKLKQVNSLTEILVKYVASFLHNAAKVIIISSYMCQLLYPIPICGENYDLLVDIGKESFVKSQIQTFVHM